MTTLPFVEGTASEDHASEDHASVDHSNWTEAAPDSNLVDSEYYDALPDVLINEYEPAHAAPGTIEAVNAIEQPVAVEDVELEAFYAKLEQELADEGQDTMSEWYEEGDEDMINEACEVASWVAGEAWVAGEVGLTNFAMQARIQDTAQYQPSPPFQAASALYDEATTWFTRTAVNSAQVQAYSPFETGTWLASERVTIKHYTPFKVGTRVAIEESATGEEAAVEATVTTMITIPQSNVVDESDPNVVVEATGDSAVPTDDREAFTVSSPTVVLQELMPHCSLDDGC